MDTNEPVFPPDPGRDEPTWVLVIDRNRMSSQLLADSLARDERFNPTVVALPTEALAVSAAHDRGVVVISADLDSGRGQGIELARALNRRHPQLGILILLDQVTREVVVDVFRSGARGIYCRTEPLSDFFSCIEHVSRGRVWAGKMETEYLLEGIKNVPSPRAIDSQGKTPLTNRELQVVELAAQGYTNRSIAEELHLSEHTVKNYLCRSFEKIGISNRVELLFYLTIKGMELKQNEPSKFTVVDPEKAFRKAAAQFDFALAYRNGENPETDLKSSYFWSRIAEHNCQQICRRSAALAEELRSKLNQEEIAILDEQVREEIGENKTEANLLTETSRAPLLPQEFKRAI